MNYPYGKQILITGASSGIGLAAARIFAEAGYTVYAASRRGSAAEDAQNIHPVRMDVTDEGSVQKAYEQISAQGGVGIILHCAGMGLAGAAEDTPEAAVRRIFDVNYFGVLRVNRVFLPAVRQRGCGLVLVMSSIAGQVPMPYQCYYSCTKFALETYVESLRMEAGQYGIRAALIEPGYTNTGFIAALETAVPEDSPYKAACDKLMAEKAHACDVGDPPELAAKIALKLAEKKNPPVRVAIGGFFKLVIFLRRIVPAKFFEKVFSAVEIKK